MSNLPTKEEQELGEKIGIIVSIGLFVLVLYLRFSGVIATPAEITEQLQNWYREYGAWFVFISAIIEGIFVINLYYPGSTAILLGVAFAVNNHQSVPFYVTLIIIGFYLSYLFNYWLGKHGVYKLLLKFGYGDVIEGMQDTLREKGPRIMLTSFFHPNLAAIVTTGAGVINMPFKTVALWSAISLIIWDSIWGLISYLTGPYVIKLFSSWLFIPVMILWMALAFIFIPRRKQEKAQPVLSKGKS